jgi:quinol monooxygenase YgiN
MINLVVTMVIKEGKMEAFLAECAKIRPLVLKEKGCIAYDYSREIPSTLPIQEPINPNRVTLVERWESMEDLTLHSAAPHMKEYGPRVKDLRVSVSARVLEPIF